MKPFCDSQIDEARSLLMYANDCICGGRLAEAKKAIKKSLTLLPGTENQSVDDGLLRLLREGING